MLVRGVPGPQGTDKVDQKFEFPLQMRFGLILR
jgi:hypothetical protein